MNFDNLISNNGINHCYVIAEAGLNHNGSVEIAKQLIDLAYEAGADAVKFQKRTIDSLLFDQLLMRKMIDFQNLERLIEKFVNILNLICFSIKN